MARRIPRLSALLLLLVAAACAQQRAISRAEARAEAGDFEGAQAELEQERARHPDSADLRLALGKAYYQSARDALDRQHDEARYLAFLEQSVSEFVTAVELDPRDDDAHFWLAVIDIYRGDLRRALRGFNNARKLEPFGSNYTNIAETYVYLGDLDKAREWNDLGLRKGAPYGVGIFNDMLIAWKDGDVAEARRWFATLRANDPEMLRVINEASVPQTPDSFEEFAGYCCGSPACGPYMRDACQELALDVRERELSEEALRMELQIEMERERRLRKVYEQRKELEIEVEQ